MTCPKPDPELPEPGAPYDIEYSWGIIPVHHYWCERCTALTTLIGSAPEKNPKCNFCRGPTVSLDAADSPECST